MLLAVEQRLKDELKRVNEQLESAETATTSTRNLTTAATEVLLTPKLPSRHDSKSNVEMTNNSTPVSTPPMVLTCSKLSLTERRQIKRMESSQGIFAPICSFSADIDERTTHLIVGGQEARYGRSLRTYKYFLAISKGIWIVSFQCIPSCTRFYHYI